MLLFSKIIFFCFGSFDPENILLIINIDNKNIYFSGWPNQYSGWKRSTAQRGSKHRVLRMSWPKTGSGFVCVCLCGICLHMPRFLIVLKGGSGQARGTNQHSRVKPMARDRFFMNQAKRGVPITPLMCNQWLVMVFNDEFFLRLV